jgi:phage virion morphogenesis protein
VHRARLAVAANVGEELIELVKEGFDRQSDPSGRAWARLKVRRGRILQDTGRLKGGWHRTATTAASVSVGPSVKYATYHQTGTRRMVARKMVPDGELPRRWSVRVDRVVKEVLSEAFG